MIWIHLYLRLSSREKVQIISNVLLILRDEPSPECVEKIVMSGLFFLENEKQVNGEKIDWRQGLGFIKKILVYLITLFNLMNQFLDFKIIDPSERHPKDQMDELLKRVNRTNNKYLSDLIPVKEGLINQPLEALVKMISIVDVQKYITITHTFIQRKYKSLNMNLLHRGERRSFRLTTREQKVLLCCKIKRKDELIKFSFKFIRRQLFKKYRDESLLKDPQLCKAEIKYRFNKEFLFSRPLAIKYFESFDLSRKGLRLLKDFTELKKNMSEFQRTGFIRELIFEYIMEKSDQILRKDLPFTTFYNEILSRQLRHALVAQGVINSLEQFIEFFKI